MSANEEPQGRDSQGLTGAIGELREGSWVGKTFLVPAGHDPVLPTLSSGEGPSGSAEGTGTTDNQGASGS